MLSFAALTNSDPFPNATNVNLARRVTGGERPTIPPGIADGYQALMQACWDGSPEERPTFMQIIDVMGRRGFPAGGIDADLFGEYQQRIVPPDHWMANRTTPKPSSAAPEPAVEPAEREDRSPCVPELGEAPPLEPVAIPKVGRAPPKTLTSSGSASFAEGSLEGIICQLTTKCRGNVHNKKMVTVMSKSVDGDRSAFAAGNVADLENDREFVSRDAPGQWISWDFHGLIVNLTGYAIRTGSSSSPSLKSWKLEGSLDRVKWVELDRQSGFPDLVAGYGVLSFEVTKECDCRIIRLTMTGRSHARNYVLALSGFDIFGDFRPGNFWELERFPRRNIRFEPREPLHGILSYLATKYEGCVHRLSAVIVTASSVAPSSADKQRSYAAVNAAAVGESSSFRSGPDFGAWLCYDFYDKAVTLSCYTLKSHGGPDGGKGRCNLKSWRVEGSTDGTKWFTVDEQVDCNQLDDRAVSQTFPVAVSGEFRFIRLVLTAPSSSNQNMIWICAFELFGQVRCLRE
jgi:hypothetical protein